MNPKVFEFSPRLAVLKFYVAYTHTSEGEM